MVVRRKINCKNITIERYQQRIKVNDSGNGNLWFSIKLKEVEALLPPLLLTSGSVIYKIDFKTLEFLSSACQRKKKFPSEANIEL